MEEVPLIRLALLGTFPPEGEGFGLAEFSPPCGEKKVKRSAEQDTPQGAFSCPCGAIHLVRLRSTPIPLAVAARASPAVRGRGGYQNRCAAHRAARRFCI